METLNICVIVVAIVIALSYLAYILFRSDHITEKKCYNDGKVKKIYIRLRKKDVSNNEIKDGLETVYYPTGQVNKTVTWVQGRKQGESIIYYKNGKVYIKASYENGQLAGQYLVYAPNGNIIHQQIF